MRTGRHDAILSGEDRGIGRTETMVAGVSSPGGPGTQGVLRLGSSEFPPESFGIMAVVNRTPDSFFDRGATYAFGAALDAADRAVAQGADIVDIGGVKAGPGGEVDAAEEIRRVAGLVTQSVSVIPAP